MKAHTPRRRGFALVEVLVAVAIVGLALPAMLFSIMGRIDGIAYMRERTIASWVASNRLTELHVLNLETGEIPEGRAEGVVEMAKTRWGWGVETEPTDLEHFHRVEVQVWKDDDPLRAVVASMVTYLNDFEAMVEAMDQVSSP